MKYKVGDRVKIQSLERYNKYKNRSGDINYGCETEILFTSEMSSFCGQVATITQVRYIGCVKFYYLAEDKGVHLWVDGMFEGLVEEETKYGTASYSVKPKSNANCITRERVDELATKIDEELPSGNPYEWECPEGYIFKDENGNIINTTKIVLEKKKKEYPKTYEECCTVLNTYCGSVCGYNWKLLLSFQQLLICRDAYWKLAGKEMGLGKPWENSRYEIVYGICRDEGNIVKRDDYWGDTHLFEFPIREMRDAFKENFGPDIEICKELL